MHSIRNIAHARCFASVLFCFVALSSLSLRAQVDRARDDYNFAAGLYDRGMHERAARAFRSFTENWSKDDRVPKARFYLGQCLVETGDEKGAVAQFDAYLDSGSASFRREALFRSGELHQRLGRHDVAIKRLSELLGNSDPGDLKEPALYFLAEAATALGKKPVARRAYERILLDHGNGDYAVYAAGALGFLDFEKGEIDAALTHFGAAARSKGDPELALESRCMVAECHLAKKDHRNARRGFTRLLESGAGAFDAQSRLGLARAILGLEKWREAASAYLDYAKRHPGESRLPRALIRAASTLYEKGESQLGMSILNVIRGAEGQDARDLAYWKGLLASESGSLEEGISSLKEAVAQGGGPRRKYSLGDALSRAGRDEEAAKLFGEVIREAKVDEVRNEARFAQGYALNRLGRHEKALAPLSQLDRDGVGVDLRRDAVFALGENLFALQRYEESRRYYARLILPADGSHANEALYKRGWCEHRLEKHAATIKSFDELLRREPNGAFAKEAGYLVGKAHEALGHDAEARRAFEKLGQIDGASDFAARGLLGSGAAAWRQGDLDGAVKAYGEAIRQAPDATLKGEALFGLAEACFQGKRYEPAEESYRALIALRPRHARHEAAQMGRSWCLRELKRHEDAIAQLEELLAATKDAELAGEARYLCGLEEVTLGRFEGASKHLDRLRKNHRGHRRIAEAELLAGIAHARLDRPQRAVEAFKARLARKKDGESGRDTALYELAFCYEKGDATKERDDCFTRLVAEFPKSRYVLDARFRLAESAYAAERFADAVTHYRAVVKSAGPGDLAEKAKYKAAWSLRKLERHSEAAVAFENVAKVEKSSFAGESCYLAGDEWSLAKEHGKAAICFSRMIERHPRQEYAGDAAYRAVLELSALNRHRDVVQRAPRVLGSIADSPWEMPLRSALGDAFFGREKWGRARTAYRSVTESSEGPLAARAQYRIGLCYRKGEEVEKAIDELLKVSILYSHREWGAKSMLLCGVLMAQKGQRGKADRIFGDLVKRYPERPEAKEAKKRMKSANAKKENI